MSRQAPLDDGERVFQALYPLLGQRLKIGLGEVGINIFCAHVALKQINDVLVDWRIGVV
jgi:hypothetical protein